jgi:hypothetical protein
MSNTPQDAGFVGRKQRCVLLVRRAPGTPNAQLPSDLMEELSEKHLDVRRCDSVYMVMAELVLHEAARRSGWHRDPAILLVVEPGNHEKIDDLVQAALRWVTRPVLWRYSKSLSPRLQAMPAESPPEAVERVEPPPIATHARREPGDSIFGAEVVRTRSDRSERELRTSKLRLANEPAFRPLGAPRPTPPPVMPDLDTQQSSSNGPGSSGPPVPGSRGGYTPGEAAAALREVQPGPMISSLPAARSEKDDGEDRSLLTEAELSMLLSPDWKLGRTGEGAGA